jgi:hypothetical protein
VKIKLFLMAFLLIQALPTAGWADKYDLASSDEFILDNPVPLPPGQVFLDLHGTFTKIKTGTGSDLPNLWVLMGVLPDLQLRVDIPMALSAPKQGHTHYGYGDTRVCAKYRLVTETESMPTIGIYPKITLPSGNAAKGLGNRTWAGTFPLWLQKIWGPLKITTGAGYGINPAKGKKNYPFGGILIQWQFTRNFMLGNEFVAEGRKNLNEGGRLIYNFGGSYFFTPHRSILFSLGHSIYGSKKFIGYLGYGYTWGSPYYP